MAQANNNVLLQKITGTLGDTLTFKQRNGETVICKKSRPTKTESPKQRWRRDQFASATHLAKQLLLDPEKEKEYIDIAKRRKLDDPYTAAVQDMLAVVHAERWEDSEIYAQTVREAAEKASTANSAATSITERGDLNGINGKANICSELLDPGSKQHESSKAMELGQQLAHLTNSVTNCMLELQKAMAKATELLQAVNELNASAKTITTQTVPAAAMYAPALTTPAMTAPGMTTPGMPGEEEACIQLAAALASASAIQHMSHVQDALPDETISVLATSEPAISATCTVSKQDTRIAYEVSAAVAVECDTQSQTESNKVLIQRHDTLGTSEDAALVVTEAFGSVLHNVGRRASQGNGRMVLGEDTVSTTGNTRILLEGDTVSTTAHAMPVRSFEHRSFLIDRLDQESESTMMRRANTVLKKNRARRQNYFTNEPIHKKEIAVADIDLNCFKALNKKAPTGAP